MGQGRRTRCLRGRPTRPRRLIALADVHPPCAMSDQPSHLGVLVDQAGSRGAVGSWPSWPHRGARSPTPAYDPAPGGSRTRQRRSGRQPSQGRRPTTAPRSLDPTSGQSPVPIQGHRANLDLPGGSGTDTFNGRSRSSQMTPPRRRCAATHRTDLPQSVRCGSQAVMESGERQSADARARGHEQGSGDRRRPPAACARRPTSRIRLVGHQWVHCRRVHQGLGCRCRRPRRPAPRQTQAKSCVAVPARRSRAVALAKVARASLEQRIATAPGSMPPRAHRPSPAAKARRRRFQLERKPSDAVLLSRPGPTMDLVPTREPSPIFALCQPKGFCSTSRQRRAAVVFPVHGSPTVRNSVGCLIINPLFDQTPHHG